MDETSPAVKLREQTVLLVIRTMRLLALGQWVGIFVLLGYGRGVPGELWLAAGASAGFFNTLLVNAKHERSVADPAPVQVVNQVDDPVPVDAAPEPEPPVEDDTEPEPVPKRRRAG